MDIEEVVYQNLDVNGGVVLAETPLPKLPREATRIMRNVSRRAGSSDIPLPHLLRSSIVLRLSEQTLGEVERTRCCRLREVERYDVHQASRKARRVLLRLPLSRADLRDMRATGPRRPPVQLVACGC